MTTPFCPRCGEESLVAHDLTLRGFAEKLLHALTSIDARVVRTAWCLLRAPGTLTVAWIRGVRKAHIAPFQLFLIANVLLFALQWATGEAVFSSPLASHLNQQDWSAYARALLARRLEATQGRIEDYAPHFDRTVVLYAKSLIVSMTVPFALVLPLVFLRERWPFMAHVTFSVHLYTFLLLLFCAALVMAKASAFLGFGGLATPLVDDVLTLVILVACALYPYVAIGVVYGVRAFGRVWRTAVLTIGVSAIVVGYRFVLFLLTLYTT